MLSVQRRPQWATVGRFVCVEPLQTFRRHLRDNGVDTPVTSALPDPGQIMRIKLSRGRTVGSGCCCLCETGRRGKGGHRKECNNQTLKSISHLKPPLPY